MSRPANRKIVEQGLLDWENGSVKEPSDIGGHLWLAVSLSLGVLFFGLGVLGALGLALNTGENGWERDSYFFLALAAAPVLGLMLVCFLCLSRRLTFWPWFGVWLTGYFWLVGVPLFIFVFLSVVAAPL